MKQLYYSEWHAMGCAITVQLETDADGRTLLDGLPAHIEALEAQLSRFRPNSDLMRFNAQAGEWVTVDEILFANIVAAKHAARLTGGAFNPLVLPALLANGYDRSFDQINTAHRTEPQPCADWRSLQIRLSTREVFIPTGSALDLGGIAKGWTAAHIADDLAPYGACLINFGGDLVARSAPEGYPGWEVTIADPLGSTTLSRLWLRDASLATSGIDYRQWQTADGTLRHHIIDPRTGHSATTDVLTVSVLHPSATLAEAYTKGVLLRGAQTGLHWLHHQWDTAGLVVQTDGTVLATPAWPNYMLERNL